ncbi:GNAT family N-acetyltransferase [Natroniella sulfidigena]|uniref:GNAT family N-acetyltransferase n=1 Tax=Natroniella sulfidigena TaxID=723921 RepID=UPI00200AECDE|nr:GNAT family N-acetyltransferase [Natroniella sulfidigena]MCK8816958.1 GNAT family N-acetyltransferase [Natroniella sulfidigena]
MEWKLKFFDQLSVDELYKLLKVRVDVFVVEQDCPYPECDNKDRNSFHLFAEKEGEILAYARLILPGISYPEASIGRVVVVKEYRKQGLGRELMKRGIDFLTTELKQEQIRISAQQHLSSSFYGALGFEVVSEPYLEDGIPHVEMLYQK